MCVPYVIVTKIRVVLPRDLPHACKAHRLLIAAGGCYIAWYEANPIAKQQESWYRPHLAATYNIKGTWRPLVD